MQQLITLAHAQAEADELADGAAVTEPLATLVPPLHRLWKSFIELGRGWKSFRTPPHSTPRKWLCWTLAVTPC